MKIRSIVISAAFVALLIYLSGLLSSRTVPRTITLYGFSILSEVIEQGVAPAFKQQQLKLTGEQVEILTSFAGSGTVVNQIRLGVPVQLAILAHQHDALKLADAGVIEERAWRSLPSDGALVRTPIVIVVRAGNPHQIQNFSDLAKSGLQVIQPDPLVSGGAAWGLLAIYGSRWVVRHDQEAATQLLTAVSQNVRAQASSARAARTQFEQGFGDVLITYEQEALASAEKRKQLEQIVYPSNTILCEPLVVRIDRNISANDAALVQSLVDFMWSPQGQAIFQRYGFRSFDGKSDQNFAVLKDPFTVTALGGWRTAYDTVVDGAWSSEQTARAGRDGDKNGN